MKQVFTLVHATARSRALEAVRAAPDGMVVEVKPPNRTLEQNALLWSRLTEISRRVEWHGRYLDPESWKHIFTAALSKQDVVPGIDGGFVILGKSTARMSKREMTDLLDLIDAFAAERNIDWKDDELAQ
ncbi:MAG: recombination protein NinB [Burkholderiales bacterium]|nr:recombination protein NinB [Burkholderiales bacterium]